MSAVTGLATAAVGLAFVAVLWLVYDGNIEAIASFLRSNWAVAVLGFQIVAAVLLMACKKRVASIVLTCTALLTLVGMVMA